MKKILLIFSLILFTTLSYSQSFKRVKIDSLVSVSLPATYLTKDTLNQRIFSANMSYGYAVVIRQANAKNNTPLEREKDLKNVFKDYVKGMSQLAGGIVQNKRDTTVGTLKGLLFTLRTDDGNGKIQFRRFLLLYTQEATYIFQYFYDDIRAGFIKDEVKTYYNSIKLSPELQRNDQYLATGGGSGLFGISQMLLYGGATIIILAVVFTIVIRRKKRDDFIE